MAGKLAAAAPCYVAVIPRPDLGFEPDQPVLVPFGGGRDEWAALEPGAWLARANSIPLRLLGHRERGRKARREPDACKRLARAPALRAHRGPSAPVLFVRGGLRPEASRPSER